MGEEQICPHKVRSMRTVSGRGIGILADLHLGADGVLRQQLLAVAMEPRRRVPSIPERLRDEVIRVAHITGGHMGIGTTIERIKKWAYFPHMRGEVEDHVKTCAICQRKTGKGADQSHTLVSPTAGYPFQRLHIDIVGPLNGSKRSRAKYILTCRDAFSKWPEAFALKDIDALTIVSTLERAIFARFRYPEAIHSDQGPQFIAKLFKQLQPQLGIKIMDTMAYNPKSNSQVERMHRDLNGILKALATECRDPFAWEDQLPQALFALRMAICKSMGLALYQILFGHKCSTPINAIYWGHTTWKNNGECGMGPALPKAKEKNFEHTGLCM